MSIISESHIDHVNAEAKDAVKRLGNSHNSYQNVYCIRLHFDYYTIEFSIGCTPVIITVNTHIRGLLPLEEAEKAIREWEKLNS